MLCVCRFYIFCYRSLAVRLRTALHLASWFKRIVDWAAVNEVPFPWLVTKEERARGWWRRRKGPEAGGEGGKGPRLVTKEERARGW